MSAHAKEQILYELGSDNTRKLINCKRLFEGHKLWLAANREALQAQEDDDLMEEGMERLKDLEEKRPRNGVRCLGLSNVEKEDIEKAMVDEIDQLRLILLEQYKAELCEDGDEDEDDAFDVE